MGALNPPLGLERLQTHTMVTLRQAYGSLVGVSGVMGPDHLEVTETATPSMAVRIRSGQVVIPNTTSPEDGPYHAWWAEDVRSLAPSDATNDRIDLVVARVWDGFYAGDDDEWDVFVVTGVPSAEPEEPDLPDNCELLAAVTVPAQSEEMTNQDRDDRRGFARLRAQLLRGVDLGDWEATEPGHLMTKQQIEDYVADEARVVKLPQVSVSSQDRIAIEFAPGVYRSLRLRVRANLSGSGEMQARFGGGGSSELSGNFYRSAWESSTAAGGRDEGGLGNVSLMRIGKCQLSSVRGVIDVDVVDRSVDARWYSTGGSASAAQERASGGGLYTQSETLDRVWLLAPPGETFSVVDVEGWAFR